MEAFCINCNSMQPASLRPLADKEPEGASVHDLCCDTCHTVHTTLNGMSYSEVKKREFEQVTAPVIDWLNKNGNPHMAIHITPTTAELSSGEIAYTTERFMRD